MIGKRMGDKLLEGTTLKFYQWEGCVCVCVYMFISIDKCVLCPMFTHRRHDIYLPLLLIPFLPFPLLSPFLQ